MARLRVKRTSQPQFPVRIDRSNPLTNGLTDCYSGATIGFNNATGKNVTVTGGGSGYSQRAVPGGKSLYTPNGGWADISVGKDWAGPNTVIALIILRGMDSNYGGLFSKNSSGTSTQLQVGRSSTFDTLYLSVENSTIGTYGSSSIAGLTGVPAIVAFSHSGVTSTNGSYYLNGIKGNDTNVTLPAQNTGTGVLGLGRERASNAGFDSDVDWLLFLRWNRVLSAAEIKSISDNPWQVFSPLARTLYFGPVSGGSTGTVAYTNANDTSAASGTTTVTGSLARTNANDTSAASGTTTVIGSLAKSNANDTSNASGTTTVTGTLAKTNANDTLSASGSVGNSITGTVAYTNANDTLAASGTTTIVGTVSRTNANDASAANGTTTIVGTVAKTNANDTVTASGIAGAVNGTVAYTNANDIVSASGTTPSLTPEGVAGIERVTKKQRKDKQSRQSLKQWAKEDIYGSVVAAYREKSGLAPPQDVAEQITETVLAETDSKVVKSSNQEIENDLAWIEIQAKIKKIVDAIDTSFQDDEDLLLLAMME